jgi:6-phosphogluconate dehydrogenase (decarboxylating)
MLRNEASTSKGLSGRIELQEFAARLDVVKRVWSFAYPKSKSNMNIDAFLLFLDVAADGEASSLSEISAKRGLSALTGLQLLDTVLEAGMGVIRKFEIPMMGGDRGPPSQKRVLSCIEFCVTWITSRRLI